MLVYQFATASALAPWLRGRPETLVVNYHNVTPPELYAPWDNAMARHQLLAQTQLRQLAPRSALGLAVSAFNEAELRDGGLRPHRGRPAGGHRPDRDGRSALTDRRAADAPAPAGSASAASPPTRASSSPSWRSS